MSQIVSSRVTLSVFSVFALFVCGARAQATDISGTISTTLTIFDDSELVGDVNCMVAGARLDYDSGRPRPAARAKNFVHLALGALTMGKYFEEFKVGETFQHQPGRTVTETDNLLITTLTMNVQPLHLDAEFGKTAEFGQVLVNSIFTLGLTVGLSVGDLTLGTTVGNLGFEKVEFPKPVFIGDTLYAESEVLEVRPSKSHPTWGIVILEHRARNQRNETVMRCKRAAMMLRKPNK